MDNDTNSKIGNYLNTRNLINCRGKLLDLSSPIVMGIINITPDSFFVGSRFNSDETVLKRVNEIVDQGGTIIDIGAYSSRPGAIHIPVNEELKRLMKILELIRKFYPQIIISVDTFRAEVAYKAVTGFNVDIINDISGGEMDDKMVETIAKLNVPYILMHIKGTPQTMDQDRVYKDVIADVSVNLAGKIKKVRESGVNDIIIDPGFGFGKTLDQNYQLLGNLEQFKLFELPILVGISRKSMIYNFLNGSPETSLNGTTVLNTIALQRGANILRVHDVKDAVECINLVEKLKNVNA